MVWLGICRTVQVSVSPSVHQHLFLVDNLYIVYLFIDFIQISCIVMSIEEWLGNINEQNLFFTELWSFSVT